MPCYIGVMLDQAPCVRSRCLSNARRGSMLQHQCMLWSQVSAWPGCRTTKVCRGRSSCSVCAAGRKLCICNQLRRWQEVAAAAASVPHLSSTAVAGGSCIRLPCCCSSFRCGVVVDTCMAKSDWDSSHIECVQYQLCRSTGCVGLVRHQGVVHHVQPGCVCQCRCCRSM